MYIYIHTSFRVLHTHMQQPQFESLDCGGNMETSEPSLKAFGCCLFDCFGEFPEVYGHCSSSCLLQVHDRN